MPRFRQDLYDLKLAQLTRCVDQDRDAAYMLAAQDRPFLDTVICLGPGRCMYPIDGAQSRRCAFCLHLSGGPLKEKAEDIIKRFVGGN